MRLEKHHARQHVQYGNQNYLNNRSQFVKSTCAVIKYSPFQDVRIRTTWKRESLHNDIYKEIICSSKLNRVDERDLSHVV